MHVRSHTGRSGVNTHNDELGPNQRYENCESCGGESIHEVSVEFTASGGADAKTHGNAPFRVARCLSCKNERRQRVGSMKQSETSETR